MCLSIHMPHILTSRINVVRKEQQKSLRTLGSRLVCWWNPLVWPFIWKLLSSTFPWYCLFFNILQNEIRIFFFSLNMGTFGSERKGYKVLVLTCVDRKWRFSWSIGQQRGWDIQWRGRNQAKTETKKTGLLYTSQWSNAKPYVTFGCQCLENLYQFKAFTEWSS